MSDRVDLDAVDALWEAATPGPWVTNDLSDTTFNSANERGWWWVWQKSKLPYYGGVFEVGAGNGHSESAGSIGEAQITDTEDGEQERRDAEFIAQARSLLPTIATELRDLRAKVDAVRETILAEHERVQYGHDGITHACSRCSSWSWEGLDDETVPWPCPTVAALGDVAGRGEGA